MSLGQGKLNMSRRGKGVTQHFVVFIVVLTS